MVGRMFFDWHSIKRFLQFHDVYWDRDIIYVTDLYQFRWDHRLDSVNGDHFSFLSQGGSSLLMLSICIGFILNISAEEKRKQYSLNY